MVLRSSPVRSAIADTDTPSLCRSRITINSLSLITPALRAVVTATDHEPATTQFLTSQCAELGSQTGETSNGNFGEY